MSEDCFLWDQLEPEQDVVGKDNGLIQLVASDAKDNHHPIGTGFIISYDGSKAIAVTASHNLDGIKLVQTSHINKRSHPTALPEFLGSGFNSYTIDFPKVIVFCCENDQPKAAEVEYVYFDEQADVAFLSIKLVANDRPDYFKTNFLLSDRMPNTGDEVFVMGYAAAEIGDYSSDGFTRALSRRLIVRKGKITELYPDGHILTKGPCFQTTIPTFSGMSGGPVFTVNHEGKAAVLGLISQSTGHTSSSAEDWGDEDKMNRIHDGMSIMATFQIQEHAMDGSKFRVKIFLSNIQFKDSK